MLSFILTCLTYAGLVLTAVSSIWGTLNKTTEDTPEGRKRLTRAGRIAVGFTIVGMLISISSTAVKEITGRQASEDRLKEELARTQQIILSGQPLTSLDVRWEFNGLPAGMVDALVKRGIAVQAKEEDNQGSGGFPGMESNPERLEMLYPFLRELADHLSKARRDTSGDDPGVKPDTETILAFLALDEGGNSVLPFGLLAPTAEWKDRGISEEIFLKAGENGAPSALPGGIWFCQSKLCAPEKLSRASRPLEQWPSISRPHKASDPVVIKWTLDPVSLANAIELQSPLAKPTARLPDDLRIALIHDVDYLPFTHGSLARSTEAWTFWGDRKKKAGDAIATPAPEIVSSITLEANGVVSAIYDLKETSTQDLADHGRGGFVNSVVLRFALRPPPKGS